MMNNDGFWKLRVDQVPLPTIEQWLRERFPGLESLYYDKEDHFYSWVYQTCCCSLFLYEPHDWFILEVWKYLEKPICISTKHEGKDVFFNLYNKVKDKLLKD